MSQRNINEKHKRLQQVEKAEDRAPGQAWSLWQLRSPSISSFFPGWGCRRDAVQLAPSRSDL